MLRNLLLLALVVLAGIGITYLPEQTPPAPSTPAEATHYPKAPDFAFTRLDGTPSRLNEFAGKTVLLNFWASWCAPCKTEFPQFIRLARARPEDVVILAVSVDHNRAAMERFLAEQETLPPNLIITHDPQKTLAQDLFQTTRYPETILIGPDGTLRRKYVGLEVVWDSGDFIRSLPTQ